MTKKNKFNRIKYAIVFFAICCFSVSNAQNSKFTVVIDAGHGGHDPGAIGKITREKDINLSVSLQLGEIIATNNSDVKVVFTRNTDKYLTLQERADIVNNNHADLFICIHTNSAQAASASGTESFTLGLAKSKGNLDVAMRENSVMLLEDDYKSKYKGFDPASVDSYIMFEFMQDKYIDRSISFASDIQNHFKNYANRSDRGVRQAGFWVLYRSACPSVLIELGFISNSAEEKYLASAAGQKEMAESIYKAFVSFKYEHEKKSGKVAKKSFNETESLKIDDVGRYDKRNEGAAPLKSVVANTKEAVVPIKDIVKPEIVVETPIAKTDKKQADKKQTDKTQVILSDLATDESTTEKNTVKGKSQESAKNEKNKKEPKLVVKQNNEDIQVVEQDVVAESLSKNNTKKVKEPTETYQEISDETIEEPVKKENKVVAKPVQSVPQRINTPISADKEKYVDMNAYAAATERPVYKLQLFASTKKLNSNAADFRGIRNADFFVENGMYKYTIGTDTKYEVISKLRKEMLALFPDAFVIAFLGKNKIAVNEAIKLTKKNK
ncbi:MAG: N-acetylmuramoyl-L-alanine amidase family protein [Paludibacter sp.]